MLRGSALQAARLSMRVVGNAASKLIRASAEIDGENLKNLFIFAALSLVTGLLSSCTTSSEGFRQQSLSFPVRSGVRTLVAKNWHIDDDCRHIDYPAMDVVEKPKHGRLEIVHEPLFPKLEGKTSKCQTVKVNGVVGYYTAKKGYTGSDRLVIRSPYEEKKTEESVLSVKVVD
ncbi:MULTISPECIES: hypothetical protein [unclassified Rhizobium]|uniref:hypothetical protein n=2 Tax=Rhizobium/Agrobacterium group TaxID=227290 RepID=UPI002180C9F2|nr:MULTISPECIES: hypothetical protein [unclassified Rhizobium]